MELKFEIDWTELVSEHNADAVNGMPIGLRLTAPLGRFSQMPAPSLQAETESCHPCSAPDEIPEAPRPQWLPESRKGIAKDANVIPKKWSMSIQQWITYVLAIMTTDTRRALVERESTWRMSARSTWRMSAAVLHLIKPWTSDIGCSIALLMNPEPQPVDLIILHTWKESTIETFNCLLNLVSHCTIPAGTSIKARMGPMTG